ncbi:MAG: hypothetical protein C0582_04270 [Alphaproteobacteria bacterium]|nr:MAG: hypothetical protein C0582_04270 [Alphaproteobacteria bacterium]
MKTSLYLKDGNAPYKLYALRSVHTPSVSPYICNLRKKNKIQPGAFLKQILTQPLSIFVKSLLYSFRIAMCLLSDPSSCEMNTIFCI